MSFLFLKTDFGGKISKINPAKIAPILDQMTKMELFAFLGSWELGRVFRGLRF